MFEEVQLTLYVTQRGSRMHAMLQIVKLRRGSGKDWQGMAPKAKGLKA